MDFRFIFERFTLILCTVTFLNIFLAAIGTRSDYLPLQLLALLVALQVDIATWIGKWIGILLGLFISTLVPPTIASLDIIGDIVKLNIATVVSFFLALQQSLAEYHVAQILTSNMFLLGSILFAGFAAVFYLGMRGFIPLVQRSLETVIERFALPSPSSHSIQNNKGKLTAAAATTTKAKDA